ncbi:MAG: 1-deoxy-D-xylulose-5-phosphate reductoisomerase [Cellvibrio sp.]|uniref:1-deoxy-D-xylulose-5-phosphate reductoisomerase n=1 Tax=Cellvibrio sp. TaxID=1965322 RepID=UPI00271FC1A6|nr:1-deoxy-D-xylulose-5-phosphate reductoisomerase [Cellvibrio sp.]
MNKQRLTILGSTGSVGTSTLDVVARHPDRFEVFALSASTQVDVMLAQIAQFKPTYAVMASEPHARELASKVKLNKLEAIVLYGQTAIEMIASHESVEIVMAAIVGAAGLAPCLAAARTGKRLLLANKEALVVGGELFLEAVKVGGATLLPIDSEHSAIFQCLPPDPTTWQSRVEKIILTASGGPFRTRAVASLKDVTPLEACAHPNWVMGRKISVDSATMMNKALEVIEAKYLFGVSLEQIEVVIHPQSVIHSMVQFRDASVLAQLGTPDMRGPIAFGLSWPDRITNGSTALDFKSLSAMTFEAIDADDHAERFPGLSLAWQVLRAPSGTPAVLNAANEVAVQAFLDQRIRFDQIHAVNLATLSEVLPSKPSTLDDLLTIDAMSRHAALRQVKRMEI